MKGTMRVSAASHFATFVLSLLPVAWLERLLTAVAWCQLFILSAKGAQSKDIAQEHRRKKKKKNKKKKSEDVGVEGVPPQSPTQYPIQSIVNSEVDIIGETILYEANEQHRREFEGFLRSVKDIKDVQNWLKNFGSEAPRKVAIVKLSRRILETDYGTAQAASALSFMFKFGLYPIVVHGGWNELINDSMTEVVARRKSFSQRLKAEIRKCGVGAAVLTADICSVEPAINKSNDPLSDPFKENLRFSGFVSAVGEGRRASLHMEGGLGFQVNNIDYSRLTAYLEKGKIPIWDGVAVTTEGAEVPLNGDVTTVELAHLLHPFRIIFACNDGGILDKDNKAIPVVYMDKDYEDLMSASWVSQRRKIQLLQLKRIVSVVPASCTVVVTAIDAVTHQLMYPRLANETIVKRAEENTVHVIEDMNQVDIEKLKILIEDSFGRPLTPDYFENLSSNLHRIYLITGMDGEYNGCAVIMNGVHWESPPSSDSDDSDAHSLLEEELNNLKNENHNDNTHHDNDHHHHHESESPYMEKGNKRDDGNDGDDDHSSEDEEERKKIEDTNNVHAAQKHAEHVYSEAQKHLRSGTPLTRTASAYMYTSAGANAHGNTAHANTHIFARSASAHSLLHSRSTPVFTRSASSRVLTRGPSGLSLASKKAPVHDDSSSSNSTQDYQFYYLCKFCVRKAAQGLGLGDLLWRSIQRDIDKLYWRSRTNNPLNPWYYARCQGSFRANGQFTVFWYGDDKFEDGATLISDALAKPVTILPIHT